MGLSILANKAFPQMIIMRILLIDKKNDSAVQLLQTLRDNHFEVESAFDEKGLLAKASNADLNALVMNLSEATDKRLGLIEELRSLNIQTPVLGFNSNGSLENLVTALEKGCDDYVGKNFSAKELVARLKALVRRAGVVKGITTLSSGDIVIDLLKREVRRAEKLIDLQPREFSMLEFMLRNPGQPLTKLMIMQKVWNYNFDPQTNIVDVLICRLRSKIDEGFEAPVIQTVRGVGYLFTPKEA
jgi:DNA-binding response OmpR family regulator